MADMIEARRRSYVPHIDWVAETSASITARLEAAKASQTQTRVTLGGMALISAMMLIASYNAYFSYDYRYMLEQLRENRGVGTTSVPDTLIGQAARDWATARTIQISLLGIRVSVDDAAVLGTGVLAVISLWLVLVTRRENNTIGSLLVDTDTAPPLTKESADKPSHPSHRQTLQHGDRWLIFHTISGNALFATPKTSLVAISSLNDPSPRQTSAVLRWVDDYGFRVIRNFFFHFPVLTSVIVFCIDRYSYFIHDPFAADGGIPGVDDPFFWFSMRAYFVCLIPLAAACQKANRFSLATESVLREYCVKLYQDIENTTTRHAHEDDQFTDDEPAYSNTSAASAGRA